ncbi:hypothetical protein NA57DRAFT_61225 [Rhizodiscina lignyota]|uniref:Ricin B lectin domain-containing protein n=1 Tax=Rhizodiscina lignyota TaxID=1504668 RepID=A0A9P4M1W1_9PEZI|nr:hypothetical protein NA57DRAFT_61225 [Rhizodiscina lignyota]
MSAPNFDSNTWYQITESRVDFNSSLQIVKDGNGNPTTALVMAAAGPTDFQNWQIFTLKNGSAILRNQRTGIGKQLGVCAAPTEIDASKTHPCMVDTADDPTQKWDISNWDSDQFQKLQNIGNGTRYNLDCHRGNPLFMSSTTVEEPIQPAQHWEFSSIGVINDVTYSTAGAGQNSVNASPPSSTSSTSPKSSKSSSSTSTSSSSTPTNPSNSSPSSGLSPGAAAGIGIGVAVAVIAAVLSLLFFLRWRKRNRGTGLPPPAYENGHAPTSGENFADYKYGSPSTRVQEVSNEARYEMDGHPPVELLDRHSAQQQVQELPAKNPNELSD